MTFSAVRVGIFIVNKSVFPDLAKFRQMGEILVSDGDEFFANGDGEI